MRKKLMTMTEVLYTDLAQFYDLINKEVPFREESSFISSLVDSNSSLLDVACGTGEHIRYLTDYFERIVGIDASEQMLNIARQKNPNCDFVQAYMQDLDLGQSFTVVCCLGSAVQYNLSTTELSITLQNLLRHIDRYLVFDLRYCLEHWTDGYIKDAQYENEAVTIHETWTSRRVGDFSVWEPRYEIYNKNTQTTHTYQDKHVIRLFSITEVISILHSLGFLYHFSHRIVNVKNEVIDPLTSTEQFYFLIEKEGA